MYNVWNKYTSYVFVYEKYMSDKEGVIKEIGNELKMYLTDKNVQDIIRKIDDLYTLNKLPENDNFQNPYYKETLLSKSHNTSGGAMQKYKTFFTNELNNDILSDKDINAFFRKHKYI